MNPELLIVPIIVAVVGTVVGGLILYIITNYKSIIKHIPLRKLNKNQPLSDNAKIILFKAVKHDSKVEKLVRKLIHDLTISIIIDGEEYIFVDRVEGREQARWENVLHELISGGYLEFAAKTHKGAVSIYKVTNKGYEYADL